jgi:hypothetical protein
MIIKKLQSLFQPEQYHGWGKTKRYFEGWYYKVINKDEDEAFAFIPGIAMNERGEKQAFIQVLDGKRLSAQYHKFDASAFLPMAGDFNLRMNGNMFTSDKLRLELPELTGELVFKDTVKWPNKWYSPGIMGPFTFVPFMECYHGILSMDHSIVGELTINNHLVDFSGGRGYMEKDWGKSFPSAYIWMQTNHFSEEGISLKASVAKIPWMRSSFVGFIAGLWLHNRLIEFTTYNGSKLIKSAVNNELVEIVLENRNYRLEIVAHRSEVTELASPILGFMDGRISESMTSIIEVFLFDIKQQKVIFKDSGRNAGLEVAGKVNEIIV